MTSALVVGATGLVGGQLVRLLSSDSHYDRIVVVARRPLTETVDRVQQKIFHFDQLHEHRHDLTGDHVFCALGTTRRAAGSRAGFRQVDLHYPRRLARLARANGARHFSLVSAIGASSRSPFFYNRVKAQVEAAVRGVGYPSGAILRPSVLGGDRAGRPLERIARSVMRVAPPRWRTVDARDVALAAITVARAEHPRWLILESDEIRRIARSA